MDELKAITETCKPDIVAITETWTSEKTHARLIEMDGFEIVSRNDREDMMGEEEEGFWCMRGRG